MLKLNHAALWGVFVENTGIAKDADLGGPVAVTGQKSAQTCSGLLKILTSLVRLLAVNRMEADIFVE